MTARKLLPFTVPMVAFLLLLGVVCPGCGRPASAVNGGPEDPAIRDVEAVGGVCNRVSYWPEYFEKIDGDPIVEVELGCHCVVYRSDSESGRPPEGEGVTDTVLAKLHLLTELRSLSLWDTAVTDDGLKSLVTLRHMEKLNLIQSRVTDAGLKHLTGFKKLFRLGLASTAVTNEGMKDVARLRSLTQLDLDHTKIDDAGLAQLTALTELNELGLRGTLVTDAGLKHLSNLHHLRSLALPERTVTPQGAKNLKKALPGCTVFLGYDSVE